MGGKKKIGLELTTVEGKWWVHKSSVDHPLYFLYVFENFHIKILNQEMLVATWRMNGIQLGGCKTREQRKQENTWRGQGSLSNPGKPDSTSNYKREKRERRRTDGKYIWEVEIIRPGRRKLKKWEEIKAVHQASALSKWVQTFTKMEKTGGGKGFWGMREAAIKSSVWNT